MGRKPVPAPKIFGREPIMIVSTIEGTLAMMVAFGMLEFIGIDANALPIVMLVVSSGFGIYVAYVTKDTLLGVITGFIKAIFALIAVYGVELSEERTASILTFTTIILALWQRTQTGPAEIPSLDIAQHSVTIPPEGEVTNTVPAIAPSGAVVSQAVPDTTTTEAVAEAADTKTDEPPL